MARNTVSTITRYATTTVALDGIASLPGAYAETLTALVADGWTDRLPLDAPKGRPTGDRADAIAEARSAFIAAGVTGADALRAQVLRMTYALHILAANPRREDETDDAYVVRCAKIRTIANGGDRATVDKAITGATTTPKKRGPGKVQGGKAAKGKGGTKTPETPAKPVTPAERFEAAHNGLVAAVKDYLDALDAHRKAGGKVTKASAQAAEARAQWIMEALAS